MATSKYQKQFIKLPTEDCPFSPLEDGTVAPRIHFDCIKSFGEKNVSVAYSCITKPVLMEQTPHSHGFHEFLFFIGGNPRDINSFDAEVEMSLGKEGEKHVITSATVLHIPKEMIHCPLNFKRIGKPIIFMNVALTPEYKRTEKPKK